MSEWISVKDRVPNNSIAVLVTIRAIDEKWVATANYKKRIAYEDYPGFEGFEMSGGDWDAEFPAPHFTRMGMGYVESDRDSDLVQITDWMEMPEPPK